MVYSVPFPPSIVGHETTAERRDIGRGTDSNTEARLEAFSQYIRVRRINEVMGGQNDVVDTLLRPTSDGRGGWSLIVCERKTNQALLAIVEMLSPSIVPFYDA